MLQTDKELELIFSITKTGLIVLPELRKNCVIMVSLDTHSEGNYLVRPIPNELVRTNLGISLRKLKTDVSVIYPLLNDLEKRYPIPQNTIETIKLLFSAKKVKLYYDPNIKLYLAKKPTPILGEWEFLGKYWFFSKKYYTYRGGDWL